MISAATAILRVGALDVVTAGKLKPNLRRNKNNRKDTNMIGIGITDLYAAKKVLAKKLEEMTPEELRQEIVHLDKVINDLRDENLSLRQDFIGEWAFKLVFLCGMSIVVAITIIIWKFALRM